MCGYFSHDRKTEHTAEYLVDPVAFFIALFGGPLLFTLATFWLLFIPVFALVIGGIPYLLLGTPVLMLHLRQCLAAFFAVWVTHQGLTDSPIAARSQRGPLAAAAYLMFYHREHHLFPKVPVHRLPQLAARLDADAPGYAASRKPVLPFLEPT